MLEIGKSYKVKVEVEPGKFGYGRAFVLDKYDEKFLIHLRTSKEPNMLLSKGAKIWFVSDSPTTTLNGLWVATVLGRKVNGSNTFVECGPARFEQLVQKRKSFRVPFVCPAKIANLAVEYEIKTRDISRSGISLEAAVVDAQDFPIAEEISIIVHTILGDIPIKCQIVRTEYNWLSNKTIVGLKFIELSSDAIDALEQLRAVAGQSASEDVKENYGSLGSAWADKLTKGKMESDFVGRQRENYDNN